MPCGGTLWTQYSDAPVGSEVGKLVDNDLDTKYVTYHSNVNINWNGNSSVSVNPIHLHRQLILRKQIRNRGHYPVLLTIKMGSTGHSERSDFRRTKTDENVCCRK